MKKIFALLLTLVLCLTAFAAIAETADTSAEETTDEIPEITNEPSYEGTEIAIGETGLTLSIPSDWNVAEAPEGYICAYNNADNTMTLAILAAQDIDTCWDAAAAMVDEGTAIDLQEVYINGNYFMLYSTADSINNFAYYPDTDTSCVALCFSVASADVDGSVATEILGTLTAAE